MLCCNRLQGKSKDLNLRRTLNIGGTDFGRSLRLPRGLLNAPIHQGFVGSVMNLQIDGKPVDLQVNL